MFREVGILEPIPSVAKLWQSFVCVQVHYWRPDPAANRDTLTATWPFTWTNLRSTPNTIHAFSCHRKPAARASRCCPLRRTKTRPKMPGHLTGTGNFPDVWNMLQSTCDPRSSYSINQHQLRPYYICFTIHYMFCPLPARVARLTLFWRVHMFTINIQAK